MLSPTPFPGLYLLSGIILVPCDMLTQNSAFSVRLQSRTFSDVILGVCLSAPRLLPCSVRRTFCIFKYVSLVRLTSRAGGVRGGGGVPFMQQRVGQFPRNPKIPWKRARVDQPDMLPTSIHKRSMWSTSWMFMHGSDLAECFNGESQPPKGGFCGAAITGDVRKQFFFH